MNYPKAIQDLIGHLKKLPSVGPKTAERYVFYLLNQRQEYLQQFAKAIADLKNNITICKTCYQVSEKNPCAICASPNRDNHTISVVANTRDMLTIEAMQIYNGKYHILGGLIDTIKNISPEDLYIKPLIERINKEKIKEIILSLNPNLEGETTSLYISKLIKNSHPNVRITRLAKGLPSGADLEYADEITLSNALKYRNEL
jgi:recombination protein RecR